MKHNQILFGLLTVALLLGAMISSFAQEKGHFQGNLKGSALPGIYWDPHYMADLSLGWRFNEKRFLGVNIGCNLIWGCYQGLSMTGGGGHGIALTAGFRF